MSSLASLPPVKGEPIATTAGLGEEGSPLGLGREGGFYSDVLTARMGVRHKVKWETRERQRAASGWGGVN